MTKDGRVLTLQPSKDCFHSHTLGNPYCVITDQFIHQEVSTTTAHYTLSAQLLAGCGHQTHPVRASVIDTSQLDSLANIGFK